MSWFWLLIGRLKGKNTVILDGDGYTFTDADSDGNVVIEASEEENNNG